LLPVWDFRVLGRQRAARELSLAVGRDRNRLRNRRRSGDSAVPVDVVNVSEFPGVGENGRPIELRGPVGWIGFVASEGAVPVGIAPRNDSGDGVGDRKRELKHIIAM